MTYERAKELLQKTNEIGYQIIEDAIHNLSKEEVLKIPIIDAHTKIVAEKYAWCFSVSIDGSYEKYFQFYLISSYILREEKEYSTSK